MNFPTSIAELQTLVDNAVPEDLHLDYKSSAIFEKTRDDLKLDLAKDVSAFANSDGGTIIYGIIESGHLPERVDAGADHTKWNRERIEHLINSGISPRIDGIRIQQIPLSPATSAYSIEIPKSYRGPHQERIKFRFYKRFNFSSEPMEAYEIDDVRNRRDVVLPLVSIDIETYRGAAVHLVVANIGDIAAEDVVFKVSADIPGITSGKLTPNILTNGSSFLPPGKVHRLFVGSAIQKITRQDALRFDVEVSYFNRRIGQRITDTYRIDLADYINSSIVYSDTRHEGERLAKCLDDLTTKLDSANETLRAIASIAGATGLDLSVTSIKNLRHLLAGDNQIERVPASGVPWQAFSEVLDIDRELAQRIEWAIRWSQGRLEGLDGMTPEIVSRARAAFIFEESPESTGE